MKLKIKNYKLEIKNIAALVCVFSLLIISVPNALPLTVPTVHAQTPSIPADSENINGPGLRLVVCDGPTLPSGVSAPANLGHTYVPCDFNGAMMTVQHIINLAIIAGVLVAIVGLCYAGFLYISGKESNINKAKDIFPKLIGGFIIMLSAWFIVYQILSWLTGNSGFATLLGNK